MRISLLFLVGLFFVGCSSLKEMDLVDPIEESTDFYFMSECCPKGCIECPDPDPEPPVGPIQDVLREMNKIRAQVGAGPVFIDSKLTCAADAHSKDIGAKRVCSHYGSDGSTPWKRAERCGTRAYGEIVACGHRTGADAVRGWYNSSGHRKIMLNGQFKKVGIAVHNYHWTAIFAY